MNKTKRKIIGGSVIAVCAVAAMGAGSVISRKAKDNAVPASMTSYENEKPVIILDAGHGECS